MEHTRLKAIATILVSTLILSRAAIAQSMTQPRPVVVELYTSQGCSSCPPADALLGELARRPNVLALAFHVDYWDSIGWRDRFSVPQAVTRQNRYVSSLSLSSAFTPQMIVDGRASFVGSDRGRVLAALRQAEDGVVVVIETQGADLNVALSAGQARHCDVDLIAYLPQATTAVGRGENSGRSLTEFNIVRQFRRLGSWDGHQNTFRVPVNTLPPDATQVAVLVQQQDQGAIIGAATAELRQVHP